MDKWIKLYENTDWTTYALQLSDTHWLWLRADKNYNNLDGNNHKSNYIIQIMKYNYTIHIADDGTSYQSLSTELLLSKPLFALSLETAKESALKVKNKWLEEQKDLATHMYYETVQKLNAMMDSDAPQLDMNTHIKHLPTNGLPIRAQRVLIANGYTTLNDLISLTEKEMLNIPGLGASSVFRTKKVLEKLGLSFKPERSNL